METGLPPVAPAAPAGENPLGVTAAPLIRSGTAAVIDLAERADRLGYDSFWVAEVTGIEAFSVLGFAWPDILIVPDNSETRLVWGDDGVHSSRWPVRFLTRGDHRVRSVQVQRELELVVTGTLTRLAEQGVAGTVLEKEWAAIQQTDPDEAEYCRAAARLGLDPYSDAAPYEPGILQAAETLSGQVLTDFLNAVRPEHIEGALAWISSVRPAIICYRPDT